MIRMNNFILFIKRNNKLVSNFFSLSALQVLNTLLPLITFPYLIRVLGLELFGLLSFAVAFINYFQVISEYGFNLTGTKDISICDGNHFKLNLVYNEIMSSKIVLTIISFLLMVLIVHTIPYFDKHWEIYYLTFGIVLGQALFPYWFFQGIQEMKFITYFNVISKFLFTFLIFVFIKRQSDYWLVPMFTSLGYIVSSIITLFYIRFKKNIRFEFQPLSSVKKCLKDGKYVFLSQVKIVFFNNFNILVLGFVSGNVAVGIYTSAEKIMRGIINLHAPVVASVFPHFSILINTSREKALLQIKKIARIGTAIYILILIPLFIFSDEFTVLLYGQKGIQSAVIIQILIVIPITIFLNNLLGTQILVNLGKQKIFFKVMLYSFLINLVCVYPLTYYFSYIGTSISVLITEVFILTAMYFYTIKVLKDE
jgi:PST family polysaccharide transporter